jgi:hypothetical protein
MARVKSFNEIPINDFNQTIEVISKSEPSEKQNIPFKDAIELEKLLTTIRFLYLFHLVVSKLGNITSEYVSEKI